MIHIHESVSIKMLEVILDLIGKRRGYFIQVGIRESSNDRGQWE